MADDPQLKSTLPQIQAQSPLPSPADMASTPSGATVSIAKVSTPSFSPEDLSQDSLVVKAQRTFYEGATRPAVGGVPLLAKLGQGGMGAVYYGIDPLMQMEVAVKVLPMKLLSRNPAMAQRFVREAQLAGKINSPHLVYVRNVGEDGGVFYQLMEFVRGLSAGAYLKEVKKSGQTGLPETEALEICIAAAKGLVAAHAKDIIHRDIKPDNILIPKDQVSGTLRFSEAKVADLGLARSEYAENEPEMGLQQPDGKEGQSLTGTGAALGTPGFMPPEQVLDAQVVGKTADVFSLGATLYALLAGIPPYRGSTVLETLKNTSMDRKKPISAFRSDVSRATAAVIERCLEKDLWLRYRDAAELLAALEDCLAQRGSQVVETPPAEIRPQSVVGRRKLVAAALFFLAGAVFCIACVGMVLFDYGSYEKPQGVRDKPVKMMAEIQPGPEIKTELTLETWAAIRAWNEAEDLYRAQEWAAARSAYEKFLRNRSTLDGIAAAETLKSRLAEISKHLPATPDQGMEDVREGAAWFRLHSIREDEREGRVNQFELRRRYEEFVSGFARTKAGMQAAEHLKTLPATPSRPADNPGHTVPGLRARSFEKVRDDMSLSGLSVAGMETIADKIISSIDLPNRRTLGEICGGHEDNVIVRFTGYVAAPRDGRYKFFTESDEGSVLYVGDVAVVLNAGEHPMRERDGEISLEAGKHALRVDYYQSTGPAGLIVSWSGPDIPKQTIPASAFSH